MSNQDVPPEPKPEPPAKETAPPPLRDDGMPPHLVWAALSTGILFTAVGGYFAIQATSYSPGVHFAALIACAGLGMTLAAVGGRAVGTWRSWSVAGAAAAAPLLFLMQWQLQPKPVDIAIRGELQGSGRFQQVTIWAHDSPLYVRKPSTERNFQFVALPSQLVDTSTFFVAVVNEDGKSPRSFSINCLNADLLTSHAGKPSPLTLTVRAEGLQSDNPSWFVYDARNKKVGRYNDDDCGRDENASSVTFRLDTPNRADKWLRANLPGGLFGTAYAQSGTNLKELLGALNSDSSDLRVASRIELSKLSRPDQLKSILDSWDIKTSSYRQDLGLLTAWNTAITADRATAVKIAQAFSPAQMAYLVALTGYPDQTMRYGATRLLSWFVQAAAWPNGVSPDKDRIIMEAIFRGLKSPSSATVSKPGIEFEPGNMTVNLLVALDWADCSSAKLDRHGVTAALQTVAGGTEPRARDQARKLLDKLAKC